jgi:hypothetical protein
MQLQQPTADEDHNEGLLDKPTLARRLRKCPRTLDNWMREGRIPFLKIGRSVLFSWPDVLACLRERYTVNARRRE